MADWMETTTMQMKQVTDAQNPAYEQYILTGKLERTAKTN